ncbi:hypothetical protein BH10BDE1_BH10BDE1_20360 [soil metagenome]
MIAYIESITQRVVGPTGTAHKRKKKKMKAPQTIQHKKNQNSLTKLFGTIAIGGTLAANLMACSPSMLSNTSAASSSGDDVQVLNFDAATSDRKEKSEQMALVAESLVRNNTMQDAWKLAFRALEQDQFNVRAQFVLKATAPLMELKGILKRVQPVISVQPKEYANYQSYLKQIESDTYSPDTSKFLLDGKPDLHSEREVQDVIEKVVERTDELRDWLKENRKVDFTVHTYDVLSSAPVCSAKEVSANVWELTNCSKGVIKHTGKMNIADFEAIRLAVAGVQTYLAISTAYSVDGLMKNLRTLPSEQDSAKAKYEALSKIQGFGQLRNTKFQVLLPKVMTDFAIGLKIAKKMQATLCPAGAPKDQSRKGMALHNGICVDSTDFTDKFIATVELMGQGKLTQVAMAANSVETVVTIDSKAFFQTPPGDLRSLAPTFDKCGGLSSLGDGRINGVFVHGELNTILQNGSNEACQ